MRPLIQLPPARPELAVLPAHIVVRDFPETLALFREYGVDLPSTGEKPVEALLGGEAGELLDELAELVSWRRADQSH